MLFSEALTWAEVENLPRKRKIEPAVSKGLIWSGMGLAFATVNKVLPLVESVRREFWGTTEPPFESSPKGQDDAVAWVQQVAKEDNAAFGRKRPGWVTLTMTLAADNAGETLKALRPLFGKPTLKTFAAALTQIDMDADLALNDGGGRSLTIGGKLGGLRIARGDKWTHTVRFLRGSKLEKLAERVEEVCQLSGWWSQTEAVAFITCDLMPPGAIRTTVTHKREGHEITMKMVTPVTAKEVSDQYQRILDENHLHPKSLSRTQNAALDLLYATPNFTWPQRYKLWLELCGKNPELPRFKTHDGLRGACKRAQRRASWAEGER